MTTCQLYEKRSYQTLKVLEENSCISAIVSRPKRLRFKTQVKIIYFINILTGHLTAKIKAIYVGYTYRKEKLPTYIECAMQCNYDRRCLSITYHADYNLCMMKNHLKFDYNNYGGPKRPKCSDLKSYMFKV